MCTSPEQKISIICKDVHNTYVLNEYIMMAKGLFKLVYDRHRPLDGLSGNRVYLTQDAGADEVVDPAIFCFNSFGITIGGEAIAQVWLVAACILWSRKTCF
jgi:hypothetical protein